MRILMLTDVYFPRVNGVSTSIQTYCRELRDEGHSVTIVAPDYGVEETTHEFDVVRLPARTVAFDPEDRLIRGSSMAGAISKLAEQFWDVVHIHTPFRAHQLGVRLAQRIGRPTLESYHTYFEEYVTSYFPWIPRAAGRFAVRWFSRRLCSGVNHLLVPTEEMNQVLKRYQISTPVTVVPTGVRLEDLQGGDGAAFRRRHDIPADSLVLLTVGRIALEKNIDFLLDVLRLLAPNWPTLLFVVAGEGPDAARLRRRIGDLGLCDRVRFVGNLERRTELPDCYRAADIFVFASRTETQGLVLIEAMALGVPIVSTAAMGTATVLKDARGALVSPESPVAFARQVSYLLRRADERERLSAGGPLDAQAWSGSSQMKRAIALYRALSSDFPVAEI
jgi:glycosyltransferase involved in cell wall biosynthesis